MNNTHKESMHELACLLHLRLKAYAAHELFICGPPQNTFVRQYIMEVSLGNNNISTYDSCYYLKKYSILMRFPAHASCI
jgi:hypothetical protein